MVEKELCRGAVIETSSKHEDEQIIYADHIIVAIGRKGADWLEKLCEQHDIAH